MIVDAHFHCWRLARGDYGWLVPELGAIHRDVAIDDWLAQARPLGVEAGVLVQAAPTEAETDFLLQQAASADAVLGVIGWVDLLAADAPERIARRAAQPKLKGLRPMLHDLPDADWILQPALAPALDAMAVHGLVLDALVRPVHLSRLAELCRRHPRLQVVVDHGAKPDIAGAQWQPWADDLLHLARQTQAACKLSGLLTEAGPAPAWGGTGGRTPPARSIGCPTWRAPPCSAATQSGSTGCAPDTKEEGPPPIRPTATRRRNRSPLRVRR